MPNSTWKPHYAHFIQSFCMLHQIWKCQMPHQTLCFLFYSLNVYYTRLDFETTMKSATNKFQSRFELSMIDVWKKPFKN